MTPGLLARLGRAGFVFVNARFNRANRVVPQKAEHPVERRRGRLHAMAWGSAMTSRPRARPRVPACAGMTCALRAVSQEPVIPANAGIHCGRSARWCDLAEPAFVHLARGLPGAQWAPASAGVTMVSVSSSILSARVDRVVSALLGPDRTVHRPRRRSPDFPRTAVSVRRDDECFEATSFSPDSNGRTPGSTAVAARRHLILQCRVGSFLTASVRRGVGPGVRRGDDGSGFVVEFVCTRRRSPG